MLKTKLYVMWKNIRQRCYNPKNNSFKYYGAKGIKMCEDWNIFNNFQLWAKSNGYKEGLSIERIDVSKNYEPQNCKFIPWQEQAHNKTNTVRIDFNGTTKTIFEWSEIYGLPVYLIKKRMRLGWTKERMFTEKPFVGKNQYYKIKLEKYEVNNTGK